MSQVCSAYPSAEDTGFGEGLDTKTDAMDPKAAIVSQSSIEAENSRKMQTTRKMPHRGYNQQITFTSRKTRASTAGPAALFKDEVGAKQFLFVEPRAPVDATLCCAIDHTPFVRITGCRLLRRRDDERFRRRAMMPPRQVI